MKLYLTILFTTLFLSLFAQKVERLSIADKVYSRDSLQEKYFYRIFSEEISTCFDVNQETLFTEWSKFSMDIARYIHEQRFLWGGQTQAQIEVFFNSAGKIDLFFIEIDSPNFPEMKYQELLKLIREFSKNYKFKIINKRPFSSVGTITFYD